MVDNCRFEIGNVLKLWESKSENANWREYKSRWDQKCESLWWQSSKLNKGPWQLQ